MKHAIAWHQGNLNTRLHQCHVWNLLLHLPHNKVGLSNHEKPLLSSSVTCGHYCSEKCHPYKIFSRKSHSRITKHFLHHNWTITRQTIWSESSAPSVVHSWIININIKFSFLLVTWIKFISLILNTEKNFKLI